MTEGEGRLHLNDEIHEVAAGDVVTAADGEVHWFENTSDEPFSFYEIWVPAPTETVWVVPDDI